MNYKQLAEEMLYIKDKTMNKDKPLLELGLALIKEEIAHNITQYDGSDLTITLSRNPALSVEIHFEELLAIANLVNNWSRVTNMELLIGSCTISSTTIFLIACHNTMKP